ncbi:cellulose binding domain-containing protein [Streptomyces sp. NPDC057638]|uniref:cellulose binding domain-containing protein n=1 Tax=Streptomyces sp. NPDC057638 TaxID=3346190 RepID=UPI0036B5F6DA
MRRGLVPFIVVVQFLLVFLAPPAGASISTAVFTRTATWDGGYQGRYTITNGGSMSMRDWSVSVDLPSGTSVRAAWDAGVTRDGRRHTFTSQRHNRTLAPGESTTFGMVLAGVDDPVNCSLNGASCGGGPGAGNRIPPAVPGQIRVSSATDTSLTIRWLGAGGPNGPAAGYEISRDGGPPVPVSGTITTLTGLRPATDHSLRVRSRDASGTVSDYSAPLVGTTAAQGGAPAGRPVTVAYVNVEGSSTATLPELARNSGLKRFALSFITGSGCQARWFNAYDVRGGWAREQIDALRAAGGEVTVSFGGASGRDLAETCRTVDALFAEYDAVVSTYGLTRIDMTLDNGRAQPAVLQRRSQALARLQRAHPGLRISLTVPGYPEGLTPEGLSMVRAARAAGVEIELVNVMTLNHRRTVDYGGAAISAARHAVAQLAGVYPDRSAAEVRALVGVSPMLGQNDDGRVFDQDDARELVDFARREGLGGLSFWEITRDRDACMGALYQCTNIPQSRYEFSRIFATLTR